MINSGLLQLQLIVLLLLPFVLFIWIISAASLVQNNRTMCDFSYYITSIVIYMSSIFIAIY